MTSMHMASSPTICRQI